MASNKKRRRKQVPDAPAPRPAPRDAGPAEKEPLFRAALFLAAAGAAATPLIATIEGDLRGVLALGTLFLVGGAVQLLHMAVRVAKTDAESVFRRSGLVPALFLFALVAWASALGASYRHPAFVHAYLWLGSAVFAASLVRLFRNRTARIVLTSVLLASALAVSMHGIHQKFVDLPAARARFDDDPEGVMLELGLPVELAPDMRGRMGIETDRVKDRVFSTFLHPTTLSGYFALLIPLIFGLAADCVKSGRRRAAIINIAVGLLLAWCLYETRSKGGLAALAIIALAVGVWAFRLVIGKFLPGRSARAHKAIVAGVSIVAAGFILAVYLLAQGAGHLPPVRDFGGSFIVRAGYWRASMLMIRERPVLGIGPGNFADYYQAFKRPEDQDARQAHNDYLQAAAETGLIGLAVFLWIWVAFYRRAASPLKVDDGSSPAGESDPRAPPERPVYMMLIVAAGIVAFGMEWVYGQTFSSRADIFFWLWPLIILLCWCGFALFNFSHLPDRLGRFTRVGAVAGVSAFLLHSVVEFNFQAPGMRNTLLAVAALALGLVRLPASRLRIGRGLMASFALCSIALIAGAWFVFAYPIYRADEYFERAKLIRGGMIEGDPMEQLQLMERAHALDPRNSQYSGSLSDIYFFFAGGAETPQEAVGALVLSLYNAHRAAEANPMRSINFERIGRCYRQAMDWARMDHVNWAGHTGEFLRRSGLGRNERFARMALGLFENPSERALDAYMRAENIFPSDPRSVWEVARMLDGMGEHEKARERYEMALDLKDRQYSHTAVRLTPEEILRIEERLEELSGQ